MWSSLRKLYLPERAWGYELWGPSSKAQAMTSSFNELSTQIKDMESCLSQMENCRNRSSITQDEIVYIEYRKAGYSKIPGWAWTDILIHQAAKKYFDTWSGEAAYHKVLCGKTCRSAEDKRKAYASGIYIKKCGAAECKANIDYLLGPSAERAQEKEHS